MSDYERNTVIRCRVTKEAFGTTDPFDVEERFEDLFNKSKQLSLGGRPYFEPAPTEEPFIDLILSSSYGEECGAFGFARCLTDEEAEVFLPYFRQIFPEVTAEDLRFVDYCWYNCCEAPDYFEENTIDLSKIPRLL